MLDDPDPVTPSSREEQDAPILEKLVFGLAGLGLNITFSIYLAYVQVYGAVFSRSILGYMNVCIYVAATSVVLVQILFDATFDVMYDPKVTYTFRICVGLFMMFCTLLSVPFAESSVYHVYAIGVLIGIFEGGGLSTLQQFAPVVHREMSKYANTGFTIAQVLPILLSVATGFYQARPGSAEAIAFAWIPASLCLAGLCLFIGMVLNGNFNVAFARLNRRLSKDPSPGRTPSEPRDSEREPIADRKEQALWLRTPIMMCAIVQFATNGLSIFLMPFLTYFDGASLAHILVLVRFAGELAGRIASHFCSLRNCSPNTAILILVVATIVRGLLMIVFLLGVFRILDLMRLWLFILVGVFYLLFGWTQSEVMTIIVDVGPADKDVELSRGMMFLCFAAQLLFLGIALTIIEMWL
jgi:hypothetical protein